MDELDRKALAAQADGEAPERYESADSGAPAHGPGSGESGGGFGPHGGR